MHQVSENVRTALSGIDTPTICNAIELLVDRPHTEGFTGLGIRCLTPPMRFAGYAATLRFSTARPPGSETPSLTAKQVFEYLASLPTPRVAVLFDVDDPPGRAANAGDIMGLSFKTLGGCAALVTNGAVRDAPGLFGIGLACYAAGIVPSHGYFHWLGSGEPAFVAGLEIRHGDLLVGDEHGLVRVPSQLADAVVEKCEAIRQREERLTAFLHQSDSTTDGYFALQDELTVSSDIETSDTRRSPYR